MKKSKLFLTAAIVISLVGSAFAFKANYGNGTLACRTTAGVCPATKDFVTSATGSTLFCGTPSTNDCQTKSAKVINVGQ